MKGNTNKTIGILGGLLALQVGLAAFLHMDRPQEGDFQAGAKLLVFATDAVDRIRITDDTGQTLELRKEKGTWQLPALGGFPADEAAARRLLNRLADLEKGWPVATTAGAAARFKVAAEDFERHIVLSKGEETVAALYVGTSPGLRKAHVRRPDETEVYAVAFNTFEAPARADDWIDKRILQVNRDELARIELPDFTLVRDGENWRLADLGEGETMADGEADNIAGQVSTLTVTAVLEEPPADAGEPLLAYALELKNGERHEYRFYKTEAGDYLVKASQREEYFKLPAFYVDSIKNSERSRLVQHEAEETPAEETRAES